MNDFEDSSNYGNLSGDYHDYVFKDGRLLGQFDQMYQNSKEVPWHQDMTAKKVIVDLDIAIIKHFMPLFNMKSLCDIGCGLGYVTARLYDHFSPLVNDLKITGVDVSKEAVKQARKLQPHIDFLHLDLSCNKPDHLKFDFIYMKDVLWYITDNIDEFFLNAKGMLNPGGGIYVMQSVPDTDQFVGSHLFPSTFEISKFLTRHFLPVYISSTYEEKIIGAGMDKYLRFLGRQ